MSHGHCMLTDFRGDMGGTGENEQSFSYCKLGRMGKFAVLFLMWSPSTSRKLRVSARKISSERVQCNWCPQKKQIIYRRQSPTTRICRGTKNELKL